MAGSTASADILFEAFYRIENNGKHIGYVVQRMSQTNGKKTLVSYIHSANEGNSTYETFKSVAKNGSLTPIESLNGGNIMGMRRTLRAQFRGAKAWVETLIPGSRKPASVETINAKAAPMQSSFIFYAADLAQLKKGKNYDFQFFAERQGKASYGQMNIEDTKNGIQHIVLDIVGDPQENFLTVAGDPVGARSPARGTIVYWVKSKSQAVGNLEYPSKDLVALFGDLPEGRKNPWYAKAGFDARSVVTGFPKSFGTRALGAKARAKITSPLPLRKGVIR